MNTKTTLAAWFALAVSAFGWPSDYYPSWQVDDTWQVQVSYWLQYPKWDAIATSTNLESETYPYPGLVDSQATNVTYTYTVLSVTEAYEYKAPLYNPFVSRPGHPNAASNSTVAAIIDIQAPTNRVSLHDWRLFFLTNTLSLVEVHEKGTTGTALVNPYGNDAWLTSFLGDRRIILDFPHLCDAATNETRVIDEMPKGGQPVTQTITFSNDMATVVLSRSNSDYGLVQKATFVWERGKKWWTTAKVELGTNVVLSASLVEQ